MGPDLKDAYRQRSREWLVRFLRDPEGMINQGDPQAPQLQQAFGGMVMPTIEMTPGQAEALVAWMEQEARKLAPSAPESDPADSPSDPTPSVPPVFSDRPLTSQDAAQGREIFDGAQKLANGGPPCAPCHTINQSGWPQGGTLGPDLSLAYNRLGGRRGLETWLRAGPTRTMRLLFREHPITAEEALSLAAYFEQAALTEAAESSSGLLHFFLLGAAGAALGLLVIGLVWKNRLRGVRRPLVQSQK